MENKNQILTRDQILNNVWGPEYEGYDRAVDTHIKKLRAALIDSSYHITTVIKKEHLPSHVYLGQRFGLHKPSMVMFEQVKTVNQSDLRSYIGHVDDVSTLKDIAYAIKKTLNIKIDTPKKTADVRCLCPKCMEEYRNCGKYIVRRLDPFQRSKDKCIKCSRPGWDYIISERKYPC